MICRGVLRKLYVRQVKKLASSIQLRRGYDWKVLGNFLGVSLRTF